MLFQLKTLNKRVFFNISYNWIILCLNFKSQYINTLENMSLDYNNMIKVQVAAEGVAELIKYIFIMFMKTLPIAIAESA